MYRITGLKLHNICQHADFECSISAGLTAVTGRNGSGKTTLFRALVYGLTGLVDGSWGTQQTLQKDGTADPGFVIVDFVDDQGSSYQIRRYSISSTKFKLADTVIKDGDVVAQRRKAVDAYMEEVFGMPCQMMFQLCWSRQGELAQLLVSPPAVVGAFLTQLFNAQYLEKLRAVIKDATARIPTYAGGDGARLKELTDNLQSLDLPECPDKVLQGMEQELEEACSLEKSLLVKCSAPLSECDRLTALGRLNSEMSEIWNTAKETKAKIAESRNMDLGKLHGDRNVMALMIQECTATLADKRVALADSQQKIKSFEAEITRLDASMNPEVKHCTLCGALLTDVNDYRMKLLAASSANDGTMQVDVSNWKEQYSTRLEAIRRYRDDCAKQIEETQKHLDELRESAAAIDEDIRKAEGCVVLKTQLEQLKELYNSKKQMAANLKGMTGYLDSDKQELDKVKELISSLKGRIADLRARVASAGVMKAEIDQLSKAVQEQAKCTEARKHLDNIRDALSQTRAQARYMRYKILLLNKALARTMQLTGMPFTLKLNPDDRLFSYTTKDGYSHPASHLSGAQQSMSAVAFQMALYSIAVPRMNLYLVDEPTEALDNGNKMVMASMFDRLNRMLPKADGTMLIITRDQPVIDSCGQLIEIGEN